MMNTRPCFFSASVLIFMCCYLSSSSASAFSIPSCPQLLPRASYDVKLHLHLRDQIHEDADLFNWLRLQIDTPLARIAGLQIEALEPHCEHRVVNLVVQGPVWSQALVLGLRAQLERFERNFTNSFVECVRCH
jgi:hypothetical protein